MAEVGQPVMVKESFDAGKKYDGVMIIPQMLKFAGSKGRVTSKKGKGYSLNVDSEIFIWPESLITPIEAHEDIESDINDLGCFSTQQLVEELLSRSRNEGVQSIEVNIYDEVKILLNKKETPLDIGSSGPATILVVYD